MSSAARAAAGTSVGRRDELVVCRVALAGDRVRHPGEVVQHRVARPRGERRLELLQGGDVVVARQLGGDQRAPYDELARPVARGPAQVPRSVVGAVLQQRDRAERLLRRAEVGGEPLQVDVEPLRLGEPAGVEQRLRDREPRQARTRRGAPAPCRTTPARRARRRRGDGRRRSGSAARGRASRAAAIASSCAVASAHRPTAPYAVARSALDVEVGRRAHRDRLELGDQLGGVVLRRVDEHEDVARGEVIGARRDDLLELAGGRARLAHPHSAAPSCSARRYPTARG